MQIAHAANIGFRTHLAKPRRRYRASQCGLARRRECKRFIATEKVRQINQLRNTANPPVSICLDSRCKRLRSGRKRNKGEESRWNNSCGEGESLLSSLVLAGKSREVAQRVLPDLPIAFLDVANRRCRKDGCQPNGASVWHIASLVPRRHLLRRTNAIGCEREMVRRFGCGSPVVETLNRYANSFHS